MRRRIAIILAVAVAALMVASVAEAVEDGADTAEVVVEGTGIVTAHGRGRAVVRGEGLVRLALTGRLVIIDHAGDAKITFRGFDGSPPDADSSTRLVIDEFSGVVTVRGSDVEVRARGRVRRLRAEGSGVVFLRGRGWWRAKGVGYGHWTRRGLRIQYPPGG